MFDRASIRRAMLTVVFGVLCIFAGYQYAWHKDEFSSASALKSLGLLVMVVISAGFVLWMMINRSGHPLKILAATAIGVVAAVWGKDVFQGIDAKNVTILLGSLLGFIAFVVVIAVKDKRVVNEHGSRPRVQGIEIVDEAETTVVPVA